MTPDVANRLGHALVLLSSGDEKGFARDGIQFVVREEESE